MIASLIAAVRRWFEAPEEAPIPVEEERIENWDWRPRWNPNANEGSSK